MNIQQQHYELWAYVRGSLIFLLLLFFASGPAFADGELAAAIKNRDDFFNSKELRKKRAEWLSLIKEFEAAALAQTEKKYAARSYYLGADLAWQSGKIFAQAKDFDTAATLARKSVKSCSNCPNSAAAQLILGQSLLAAKKNDDALRELMKVELNYPQSAEISEARQAITKITGREPPVPEGSQKVLTPETPKNQNTAKDDFSKKTASQKEQKKDKEPSKPKAPKKPIPNAPKGRSDGQSQVYYLTVDEFENYSTVTVYLDKVVSYVYNLLPPAGASGNFRAYVDLKGAVLLASSPALLQEKNKLIKLTKANQFKNDVVRLVVDLPQSYPYLPMALDNPPRLVLTVAKDESFLPSPASMTEAQPEPPKKAEKEKSDKNSKDKGAKDKAAVGPKDSLARQLGLKVNRVVIDPGHGGKDNGASGFNVKEKNITLKIAKKLKSKIEKDLGLTVYLTRENDTFTSLEKRAKFALDKKGDIFISLHVNANKLSKVEGYETYILNFATDAGAMEVAARENASSGKSISEMSDILEAIAKNTKISESRVLAQATHKRSLAALRKKYKVRDLGVKEAPFFVLVGAKVPAILVEIGFLTNEKEASRLSEDAYLDLVVEGLAGGLGSYIKGL